jgi:hypothetical protein
MEYEALARAMDRARRGGEAPRLAAMLAGERARPLLRKLVADVARGDLAALQLACFALDAPPTSAALLAAGLAEPLVRALCALVANAADTRHPDAVARALLALRALRLPEPAQSARAHVVLAAAAAVLADEARWGAPSPAVDAAALQLVEAWWDRAPAAARACATRWAPAVVAKLAASYPPSLSTRDAARHALLTATQLVERLAAERLPFASRALADRLVAGGAELVRRCAQSPALARGDAALLACALVAAAGPRAWGLPAVLDALLERAQAAWSDPAHRPAALRGWRLLAETLLSHREFAREAALRFFVAPLLRPQALRQAAQPTIVAAVAALAGEGQEEREAELARALPHLDAIALAGKEEEEEGPPHSVIDLDATLREDANAFPAAQPSPAADNGGEPPRDELRRLLSDTVDGLLPRIVELVAKRKI